MAYRYRVEFSDGVRVEEFYTGRRRELAREYARRFSRKTLDTMFYVVREREDGTTTGHVAYVNGRLADTSGEF